MDRTTIDAKIQEFYDIQQLIKNLEKLNKRNRSVITQELCVTQYTRRTAASMHEGWEYTTDKGLCCTIRRSIRHYIDKEQLPREVFQMYGELQEVMTVSVAPSDTTNDEVQVEVKLQLDFPDEHKPGFCKCVYKSSPKRRGKHGDAHV